MPQVIDAPPSNDRFWAQQYGETVTAQQIAFDILGGVCLPLFCLLLDPFVFQGGLLGPAMLGSIRIAAYTFVAVEIFSLLLWLFIHRQAGKSAALLGGVLFVGTVGATLLGVVLLPFAIVGLFAVIGLLGFTPFVVAWIFLRNALRAYRIARHAAGASTYNIVLIAGILAATIPITTQLVVTQATSQLLTAAIDGDEGGSRKALAQISRWRPVFQRVAYLDGLVSEYARESNPARKARLSIAFSTATTESIEERLAILDD